MCVRPAACSVDQFDLSTPAVGGAARGDEGGASSARRGERQRGRGKRDDGGRGRVRSERERVKRESGKLIPRDVTVRMFDISSV